MRGKSLFLFLGIVTTLLALVFFTTLGIKKLNAAPTAPLTVLTNAVQMDWSGGTAVDTNYTAGVGTNFGASWIGQNNANVLAGGSMSNITYFTNEGNLQADFILTSFSNFTGAANTATKTWTTYLTNMTDNVGGATLTLTMAPGTEKKINFVVSVPVTEVDAKLMTFNLFASNTNAPFMTGVNASNYTGVNGTVYGGTMGMYGQPFLTIMTNGQASPNMTNWVLTVQAATMTIAKTVQIVNPFPFNANVTTPYPGAKLAYKLAYQNLSGVASAGSVRIVDTLPLVAVTLDTTSVTNFASSAFAGTIPNYLAGSYNLLTILAGDDDAATNTVLGQVVFCPGAGGNAPVTGGTVAASGSGAYYFSVFLK